MKITASKVDDVLRRKVQYENEKYEWDKEHTMRNYQYKSAEQAVMDPVKEILERKLSKFPALKFDIRIDRNWRGSSMDDDANDTLEVRIQCNDDYDSRNSGKAALIWDWKVWIQGGEVAKESSSWSGLKACTEEQMESLRQTVRALDMLNDLDWNELLNRALPNWNDYFGDQPRQPKSANWGKELATAQLQDIIGTNKIIKVHNWGETCPYTSRYCWLQILGETPARFKVEVYSNWDVENSEGNARPGYGHLRQVNKSNIHVVIPIEIREVDEA